VAVGRGVAVGAGVALGFGVGDGVGVGLASRPIETAEKIAVKHSNLRNECSLIFGANVGSDLSLKTWRMLATLEILASEIAANC